LPELQFELGRQRGHISGRFRQLVVGQEMARIYHKLDQNM